MWGRSSSGQCPRQSLGEATVVGDLPVVNHLNSDAGKVPTTDTPPTGSLRFVWSGSRTGRGVGRRDGLTGPGYTSFRPEDPVVVHGRLIPGDRYFGGLPGSDSSGTA